MMKQLFSFYLIVTLGFVGFAGTATSSFYERGVMPDFEDLAQIANAPRAPLPVVTKAIELLKTTNRNQLENPFIPRWSYRSS